jgi:hypothetical protein
MMKEPLEALETVAERIDGSVPVAAEPGNVVLIDDRFAAVVELPLSALCWFIAHRAQRLSEKRMEALLAQRGRVGAT